MLQIQCPYRALHAAQGEPSRQTVALRKGSLSVGVIHALCFLKLHRPRLNHMILVAGGLCVTRPTQSKSDPYCFLGAEDRSATLEGELRPKLALAYFSTDGFGTLPDRW
jgi:hypothetical protein